MENGQVPSKGFGVTDILQRLGDKILLSRRIVTHMWLGYVSLIRTPCVAGVVYQIRYWTTDAMSDASFKQWVSA